MGKSTYIGNIKSKEFHLEDCYCVKRVYNINQRPFYSVHQAKKEGYDPCGHCLPTATESSRDASSIEVQYFGRFYMHCPQGSSEDRSNLMVNPGEKIELFVKLHKAEYVNENWRIVPLENHLVDISCDFIDLNSAKTDSNGSASWTYTLPMDFEPGETVLRANTSINNLIWGGTGSSTVFFTTPQQIEAIETIPKSFDQKTMIKFKLESEKNIKADIYRGASENQFSHICNLRKFSDGSMPANEDLYLEWDGTTDHGIRKGKAVTSGVYKVVIQGEYGISDRDELFMFKRQGILGGEDPEPNTTNEYISDIIFSRNPFSAKTNVQISFELKEAAKVSIHIQHINWNFIDDCVKEIILDKSLPAGHHTYVWDGTSNLDKVPATLGKYPATLGKYKVRIKTNDKSFVKKDLWKKAHWNL